ncbi:ABC transporter ATP-binding protein [Chloroflexota bacterium]
MTNLLEIRNLKKYFPIKKGLLVDKVHAWVKAVDDISFTVQEGQTFSLVGESGCGKTTTAKMILLLENISSGAIHYRGKNISTLKGKALKEYRASVQTIFQDPFGSLEPRMRVSSIISEPLRAIYQLSKEEVKQRVNETLLQVGLSEDIAHRFPHEFSGGQRQRIALARALALHPKLIVLDEPVSALDVSIRAQIMNLLKDIQENLGLTYLLIAHNLATVRYMCHTIGVMYLGKIVEVSPGEEFFNNTIHPYSKALLSAALPSHPDTVSEEIILPGEVPSALNPPSGCHFHPRCIYAKSVCSRDVPVLTEHTKDHYVACHLY